MNTLKLVRQCKKDPQKSFTINFISKLFTRNICKHYFTEFQYGINNSEWGKMYFKDAHNFEYKTTVIYFGLEREREKLKSLNTNGWLPRKKASICESTINWLQVVLEVQYEM